MKGIQKIKKKIMGDADAAAKQARDVAANEIKQLQAKQKTTQDEYTVRFRERTAALVVGVKQKNLAKARLDVKKSLLQKREEIIDSMIDDALQHINPTNYEQFLKTLLDENMDILSGTITVACNKDDAALAKKLVHGKATIEHTDITGGFIFHDAHGKRIDESLDAVLARKHDTIRQKIVGILNG